MNKVSIIIPCYNAGEFLAETMQSVLAQTYPDVEVVIVDDGSPDPATRELLDQAQWPHTRIIHQANAGPAAARNRAVQEATGVYILPLDADDTIEPGYVDKAVAVLDARPEVGVVYCKARKFGAEQGPWCLPDYTLRELVIDNVIFVTAMYRKVDWQAVGGYNERLRHGVEDYEFWVKIVHLGREVVQLDEYLFNYRIQQKSRTTSFQDERANVVATYAEIFRTNKDFYAKYAEFLFEHRFGLYDELSYWRSRYGELDALLKRHSWLQRVAKRLKKAFLFLKSMHARKSNMTNKLTLAVALIGIFSLTGCGSNEAASPDGASSNAAMTSPTSAASVGAAPVPRGRVSPLESSTLTSAQWTGASCSLDTIDGSYSKDVLKLDKSHPHIFRGWLLDEAKKPAGKFSLVLKGSSDYAISASTGEIRKDVGEYFKNPALNDAGFSVSADLSTLQAGNYDVIFVIRKSGRAFFCESGRKVSLN
jgi:glycosyltransferase involved in cell wall biosynthesis